jgi:hypothetical protein
LGENDRAHKILDENLGAYHNRPDIDAANSEVRYLITQCYAMQKKTKEAVLSLEKALANGFLDRWMDIDPLLENIRPSRECKALMVEREKLVDKMRKRVRERGLDK